MADIEKLRLALEHARLALVSKQGCRITDIQELYIEGDPTARLSWVVDDSCVIKLIDDALSQFDGHPVLEPIRINLEPYKIEHSKSNIEVINLESPDWQVDQICEDIN